MKLFKVKSTKICIHQYLDKLHNSWYKMMNIRHVQVSLDQMKSLQMKWTRLNMIMTM